MTILPNNILILSNDLLYISGNVYRLIAANNIGLYGCHECIFREVDLLLFSHECKLSVRLYILTASILCIKSTIHYVDT